MIPQLIPVLSGGGGVPAWVLRDDTGAPALLQIEPQRYWFDGVQYANFADLAAAVTNVTVSVSSAGTRRDSGGNRVQATANELRLDHDVSGNPLGWLIEGASNNVFLNSEAPVTQTVVSGFNRTNIWTEGSGSVGVSGPTTATATEASPVYYDLAGSVTLTPTGDVDRVQVEKNNSSRIPSSYIPTGASSVSRTADILRIGPDSDSRPLAGFSATEGTVVVRARSARYFNIVDQTLIQLDNNDNNNRIKVFRTSSGSNIAMNVRLASSDQAALTYSGGHGAAQDFAIAAAWKANDFGLSVDGATELTDTSGSVPTISRIRVGADAGTSDFWGGHIKSVAYFPRRVPALSTQRQYFLSTPERAHGLGDSFMSSGLVAAMRSLLGSTLFTADGVGGSTLADQAIRWAATPTFHDQVLVMTDDMAPLTDSGADIAAMLATYASILSQLHGGRFLILEPGFPIGGVGGSASRVERDNKWAAIVAAYPNNVVPVTAAMQAAGDGSALDNDYIAAGLWPGSCLVNPGTDPTTTVDGHLNAKGNGIYAAQAYAKGQALGYWA